MDKITFLVSALSLFLSSCGDYEDDLEYFPLEAGRTWEFSRGVKGAMQAGKEPDELMLTVDSSATIALRWKIALDDDHLVARSLDFAQGVESKWIRFPLDEEEEWRFRLFTGEPVKAKYEGRGATKVPAGVFNDCVKIRYTVVRPSGKPIPGGIGKSYLLWFARDVGLVRIDLFGPTARQPYVLQKYTKP